MNSKKLIQKLRTPVLTAVALVLMTGPSLAVDLMAVEGSWNGITMWGFATDTGDCATAPTEWEVGPVLTDADLVAGDLTINLRNCLSEPVSIVIPGQPATFTPVTTVDGQGRSRITAFTNEAPAGGVASYTWTGVKAGTYLYQSGSHPAKQVQMGLYGALTIGTYAGTSGDVTLLYSEIDPALHNPPAAATPLGYKPMHYLVNGKVAFAPDPSTAVGNINQPIVLRFLNAGLDFHVPALNGGHMSLVAEDGNPYPFVKEQYSANLAAGKTIDALWQPATEGNHVIYDRRGNGMVASLTVDTGTPPPNTAPVAADDGPYDAVEFVALNVGVPGVLGNDIDVGDVLTVTTTPVTGPGKGTLALNANGSFVYTSTVAGPDTDSFTYQVCDDDASTPLCDTATVNINISVATPNTPPVAVNDVIPAIAEDSTTLFVNAPGVLGNDTDADAGDTLNAVLDADVSNGTLALNVDGSFTYLPDADFNGTDSFTYHANDGAADSNVAIVSITVNPVNDPPTAVDDGPGVPFVIDQGSTLNVAAPGVLANDTDIDVGDTLTASLVPGSGPNASEGFVFNSDGSFTYVTADNAAVSDSFSYEVCDDAPTPLCDTATVNITINQDVTNTPPVANPDLANVVRRTTTFINLTGNDTDVDNNIDPNGIVITSPPNQGGNVVVMANGVDYTPDRNFWSNEGAEEDFSYTVSDLNGAMSNEVTVTVKVYRTGSQLP